MRAVIEKNVNSIEAVKLYHSELIKKKIQPDYTLKKDLKITDPILKL